MRIFVIAILMVFLFLSCEFTTKKSKEKNVNRPNIVLIVADDHGQNDLGCYGNKAIQTPNLDYLATEGVRFTNAYCTSASCSASRSTILTGVYNHASGHFGHMHHYHHFSAYEHVKSLPVLLEQLADYKTARIGKYHLAPESVFHFDKVFKGNERNPVEMADNCNEFIAGNKDQPFFLYFCTGDPHRAGNISDEYLAPNSFGNKAEGYQGVTEKIFKPSDVLVPPYLPNSQKCREELAQYYQSVARVDQGVGRLFRHIKDAGLWDNTIVIYISDNGIAFEGAKTNQYQAALNLPCIIKLPHQINNSGVSDALINWTDLTPTILDYAGVLTKAEELIKDNYNQNKDRWDNTYLNGFQGRSFKHVLETLDSEGWDETYASHTFHEITMYYPMKTVITREYKLIWNLAWQLPYPQASDLWESSTWQLALHDGSEMYGVKKIEDLIQRPEYELYNLVSDPHEANNLAYNNDYLEILDNLKTKLYNFQKRTQDPWIVKWEHQ